MDGDCSRNPGKYVCHKTFIPSPPELCDQCGGRTGYYKNRGTLPAGYDEDVYFLYCNSWKCGVAQMKRHHRAAEEDFFAMNPDLLEDPDVLKEVYAKDPFDSPRKHDPKLSFYRCNPDLLEDPDVLKEVYANDPYDSPRKHDPKLTFYRCNPELLEDPDVLKEAYDYYGETSHQQDDHPVTRLG